jgi:hypothetical protein
VGQFQLDNGAPGAAFGIAVSNVNGQVRFAAADDNTNSLDVWTFETGACGACTTGITTSRGRMIATARFVKKRTREVVVQFDLAAPRFQGRKLQTVPLPLGRGRSCAARVARGWWHFPSVPRVVLARQIRKSRQSLLYEAMPRSGTSPERPLL